jgi:predicted  nucleic acid-binding Zn-ribbon protein
VENVSLEALNERSKNHENRIGQLEKKAEEIPKLETLMQVLIKQSEDNAQAIKEQSKTLSKINENLTGLNTQLQNLDNRVGKLENNKESQIKRWIEAGWKIGVLIVGGWLIIQFGLK